MLPRNMRRELISEERLMSSLRQQGVEDLNQVKRAFMERDGRISVVQYESKAQNHDPRNRSVG